MIQSIYTSVSNAGVVPCKKGQSIKSEPIPLLRDKYLGEYRTELEKAKVRKNLGISEGNVMAWGNIEGFVEEQKDLVSYVESKWLYKNEISSDITNVKQALDYAIYFISNYKTNDQAVKDLNNKFLELDQDLTNLSNSLQNEINLNAESINNVSKNVENSLQLIQNLELSINTINKSIEELNESLININVDSNILAWVEQSLTSSKTIELQDNTLNVLISKQANNAIQVLEHREEIPEDLENGIKGVSEILPGLFVKDLSQDLQQQSESVNSLQQQVNSVAKYTSNVTEDTTVPTQVGGIKAGTTAGSLFGKTINQIIDIMLFPTVVRDLVYPSAYYSSLPTLIKVGSAVIRPTLNFRQGDAGSEVSRTDLMIFQGEEVTSEVYDKLGTYVFNGSITYEAGQYLIDSKGDVTDQRVEAGTKTAAVQITTTYPWYVDNQEQALVAFNTYATKEFTSGGNTTIKLPGNNTTMSLQVNAGMGFLDVDMSGWNVSTTTINNFTYQVWSKKEAYVSNLPHKITFTLIE